MSEPTNNEDLMPWVDIETFGLDAQHDPIIEIGIKVTTSSLETVTMASWLVWSSFHDIALEKLHRESSYGNAGAKIVLAMHSKNGLLEEAKEHGNHRSAVGYQIMDYIKEGNFEGLPMCGSSVQFDRDFLHHQFPLVERLFHYRNIDVSTCKELCRRYRPDLFEKRPDDPSPHRALPDLDNTIKEFDFYKREFLNV